MTQTILQLLHWLAINFLRIKQSINQAPVHLFAGNIIFLSGCQKQFLPAWEQFIWDLQQDYILSALFLFDNKQVLRKKDILQVLKCNRVDRLFCIMVMLLKFFILPW